MEYVDGVNLQAAVSRHGAFTSAETATVGVEVARGLAAAAARDSSIATSSRPTSSSIAMDG